MFFAKFLHCRTDRVLIWAKQVFPLAFQQVANQEGSEALQGFASCAWAGFGPRPSFRPHRNPGLQAGERAISGLKAGVSDHKGIER